jgi:hypothetical protein
MNERITKFLGKKKRLKRSPVEVHGPSGKQRDWLLRGIEQAGGKLPLFDEEGQRYSERTIKSCLNKGWAEPWFANPLKPDWLVCRLTDSGRHILHAGHH